MKKDAGTATAEATEETETAAEPQTWDIGRRDEIMDLGFRTEQTVGGFRAAELLGDRIVPSDGSAFETLDELLVAVRAEVERSGVSQAAFERDADGFAGRSMNSHPTRPDVIDAVTEAADEIEATVEDDDEALAEIERVIGEGDEAAIDAVEVDEDEIDDGDIEVTETPKGRLLPTMGHVVNKELTDAACSYHAAKMARVEATAKETAERNALKIVAAKHEKLFTPDPENSHCMIYNAGGIILRHRVTQEDKWETEEVK